MLYEHLSRAPHTEGPECWNKELSHHLGGEGGLWKEPRSFGGQLPWAWAILLSPVTPKPVGEAEMPPWG